MKRRSFIKNLLQISPVICLVNASNSGTPLFNTDKFETVVKKRFYAIVLDTNEKIVFPKRRFVYHKRELQVEYTKEDFVLIETGTFLKEVHIEDEENKVLWVHKLDFAICNRDTLTLHLSESMSDNIIRLWDINHSHGISSGYSVT